MVSARSYDERSRYDILTPDTDYGSALVYINVCKIENTWVLAKGAGDVVHRLSLLPPRLAQSCHIVILRNDARQTEDGLLA